MYLGCLLHYLPLLPPVHCLWDHCKIPPPPSPLFLAVDDIPPTPPVHVFTPLATYPCPPPTADTLPPLVVITSTPPPDPTSRPSSSSIPVSETATTSADPETTGDAVDPPLHDRPWIEPYGRGFVPSKMSGLTVWASTFGTLYSLIGIQQRGTLKHQPSSSTTTTYEAVKRLTQLLQQCDQKNRDLREEYTELRNEFTNFKSLVMRALPEASDIHSIVPLTQPRPSPSPAITQQPTSPAIYRGVCSIQGGTLKHQPSSSTTTTYEAVKRLTQLLQQCDQKNRDLREEYTELRNEFTNFKSLVMRALPEASDIHSIVPLTQPRPSPSPAITQQPTSPAIYRGVG
ncbi:hypothetical protein LR48_Vigan10g127000 [Vigna angularis]|uniref:Uncharacterized protein n=1 Tax=Phaseolus angularis TaxID=3914 RepID=A0A0L9VK65_PHAAN|nr:hypothetical protein LR48_Vigan10g127000 [Vigna angularis]